MKISRRERKLVELHTKIDSLETWKDLCNWYSAIIRNKRVALPTYGGFEPSEETNFKFGNIIGRNSTGGTRHTIYADICDLGWLSVGSQDGFCSGKSKKEGNQHSYFEVVAPVKEIRKYRDQLTALVSDFSVSITTNQGMAQEPPILISLQGNGKWCIEKWSEPYKGEFGIPKDKSIIPFVEADFEFGLYAISGNYSSKALLESFQSVSSKQKFNEKLLTNLYNEGLLSLYIVNRKPCDNNAGAARAILEMLTI
jgi:hypothetical protein